MKEIADEVYKTIHYFGQFSYPPTFVQLHTFLEMKISAPKLQRELEILHKKGKLVKKRVNRQELYTLGEYTTSLREVKANIQNSKFKIQKIQPYVWLLTLFPQIRMIGLSGSVAMMNAGRDDDIDLFIITAKRRLWTGRALAIFLAELMGVRRRPQKTHRRSVRDKICLNLFFEASGLAVPPKKRSLYGAHEVLQMKPLRVKGDIYVRFLRANAWVYEVFPNAIHSMPIFSAPMGTLPSTALGASLVAKNGHPRSIVGNLVEQFLSYLQLRLMRRHRTTEIISPKQLWFFPEDFEKKLARSSSDTVSSR